MRLGSVITVFMRYTLARVWRLVLVPVSGSGLYKGAHRATLMGSVAFGALLRLSTGSVAEPAGGVVVHGQAGISQAGSLTTISQASDKAVINWQSFSIGRGETVTFNQPSVSSVTLNRVIGNEQSVISGALNANGQVFLVNSNGIVFNRGAQVNVGGLVASTLDISDANFMAGRYRFEGSSQAAVINRGHIRASNGGYIALLGKTVSNDGVISATLGTVAMASGRKITLNFEGNSLIDVTIDEGTLNALVENKRAIKADGGRVILTAKAADALLSAQVNNSGVIQARSMSALKGGHGASGSQGVRIGTIKLSASGGSVTSTGRIVASAKKGGNGGSVSLAATGGTVTLAGEVDVSSLNGSGGLVTATGQDVALTAAAAIKADGATGGTILIGGDRYGGNDPAQKLIAETLANAATVAVAAGATLSANGSNGNGGNIVVWSDQHTDYAGSITATGAGNSGQGGGNGGFAEVSSHGLLGFTGSVNLASANGVTGTLLLDPYNVTISSGADSGNNTNNNNTITPTSTSVINVSTLIAALANANVTITTGTGGTEAGNITIASALNWTTPHTLTLTAANDITINGSVSWGAGGGLTATATGGNINVNAPVAWNAGTLALNAGQNVNINAVLTASGSGSFVETNGSTGVFYFNINSSGYTGKIDFAGNGSVTINGENYSVIRTSGSLIALLRGSNLSGNYVLGADLVTMDSSNRTTLTYANLAPFGFSSSTGLLTGNFNGLGHTLLASATNNVAAPIQIASPITIPSNITNVNFTVQYTSLAITAPVGFSNNIVTFNGQSGNNGAAVTVNSPITVGSHAGLFLNSVSFTNPNRLTGWLAINSDLIWSGDAYIGIKASQVDMNVPLAPVGGSGPSIGIRADTLNIYAPQTLADTNFSASAANIFAYAPMTWTTGFVSLVASQSMTIYSPLSATGGGALTLQAGTVLNINAPLDLGNAPFSVSANDLNINAAIGWAANTLTLNATNDINLNVAVTPAATASGLVLNAGRDVNLNANTVAAYALTASAGRNININEALNWSNSLLTLNAAANIYVGAVMTATGTAALAATNGTGVNPDGSPMCLCTVISDSGIYTGRIDYAGSGAITLNGASYTLVNSIAGLQAIANDLNGNYVLGSELTGLSYADLGIFGLSATAPQFTGNFNGFGHSLTPATASSLSLGTPLTLHSLTNTNLVLNTSGAIDINAALSTSVGLLTFNAGTQLNVNADITGANANASIVLAAAGGVNFGPPISVSAGSIYLNSAARWNTDTVLTLNAFKDIYINAPLTAEGAAAGLVLTYGNDYHIRTPASYAGASASAESFPVATAAEPGRGSITLSGANATLTINGNAYVLIRSMADLEALDSQTAVTGYYAIAQDIVIPSDSSRYASSVITSFGGVLTGLGHTIDGFKGTSTGGANAFGLIGETVNGSVVRDLGLTNVDILSDATATGALVGSSTGTDSAFENVYATGTITATGAMAGGLIGMTAGGTISHAYTNVALSDGRPAATTIDADGYLVPVVTSSNSRAFGGLVGLNRAAISYSHALGDVTARADFGVGGLVGRSYENAPISYSFATGNVTNNLIAIDCCGGGNIATGTAGGLVGNANAPVTFSFATGNVRGGFQVGGLIGTASALVSYSYATGNVSVNLYPDGSAGGLVGNSSDTLSHTYATGDVQGYSQVGGLAGRANFIQYSYATGNVRGLSDDKTGTVGISVGGLAGEANLIANSHATGAVTSSGDAVGGLAGRSGPIISSYAINAVVGRDRVGGLVGIDVSLISNSYHIGNVTGRDYVGGVVGDGGGIIVGSDNKGDVTGRDYVGSIAGQLGIGTVLVNSSCSPCNVTGENYVGGLAGIAFGPRTFAGQNDFGGTVTGTGPNVGSGFGGTSGNVQIADSNTFTGSVSNGSTPPNNGSGGNNGTGNNSGSNNNGGNNNNSNNGGSNGSNPNTSGQNNSGQPSQPNSSNSSGNQAGASNQTGQNGNAASQGATGAANARQAQASQTAAAVVAAAMQGGNDAVSPGGLTNPSTANTQTASLGSDLDGLIANQIPATTVPPKPKEKKERKQAVNTSRQKPDSGYGASIRSIVIDGQTYDLQDGKPKNDGTGQSSKDSSKPQEEPKTNNP